jgi:ribokinase
MGRSGVNEVTVLGIFAADLAFRAHRLPVIGETLLGSGFSIGCGGKGSNQAVAASRCGASTRLITRIGRDVFADMAMKLWTDEGIDTSRVARSTDPTGAAFIFVDERTGENALIVESGAAGGLEPAMVEEAQADIASSAVFVTQLEQSIAAAKRGLEIAKSSNVVTVFNPAPAPALPLPSDVWRLCDYVTPNETEASAITGIAVADRESAIAAAERLIDFGVQGALITLGERGAYLRTRDDSRWIDAVAAGTVVDTTGAGDAFNGGFCAAIAEGASAIEAARFASVVAGIAVTRPGTAAAMPSRAEIDAWRRRG